MASKLRSLYPIKPPSDAVEAIVVGGGVVGLAIARRLARLSGTTTFLLERNSEIGQETSSRNSEVIHAGIYYPKDSQKTSLCIRGRELLYKYCQERNIEHRKTGKLIFALTENQLGYLERMKKHISTLERPVPLESLSGQEACELEPDLSPECKGALFSPETGIINSHDLMSSFANDIEQHDNAEIINGCQLVRVDRATPQNTNGEFDSGWIVQTRSKNENEEPYAIHAKLVINAAGLSAHHVFNQILPLEEYSKLYYAKGSYFGYRGPGVKNVSRLLYPCPDEHNVKSLGVHLTMDMMGEIRFGPDIEWMEPPRDPLTGEEVISNIDDQDCWNKWLTPNEERLEMTFNAVKKYLPNVEFEGLSPTYVGIRPKLIPQSDHSFSDFSISHPYQGFINLMGIESPGLTSSMAIAEKVEKIAKTQVFGLGKGTGSTVSALGQLDDWK